MPGAGGALPTVPGNDGGPERALDEGVFGALGSTDAVLGITGGNGVRRRTLQALLDRVQAAERGGRRTWLVGHSFGSRNAAHLAVGAVEKLSKQEAKEDPRLDFAGGGKAALASVAGLILLGYPIADTKGVTTARRAVVERLWREAPVPVLFVKGTADGDIAAFRACVDALSNPRDGVGGKGSGRAFRDVHYVEGGGHNPFKGGSVARGADGRPAFAARNDAARQAIADFVARCERDAR